MSTDLTLYIDSHFFSPYAMFAYVALREKGQAFRLEQVNLDKQEHHDSVYQALSLTCRVPTLRHGDFHVSESSAIMEYLEELFPPPQHPALLPAKAQPRARARQLQAWLRSDLQALREERPSTVVFDTPVAASLSKAAQAAARHLIDVANELINEYGDPLFGTWSIVDTELALMLNRLMANGDPLPHKLQRYVTEQWRRPSVQHWLQQDPS